MMGGLESRYGAGGDTEGCELAEPDELLTRYCIALLLSTHVEAAKREPFWQDILKKRGAGWGVGGGGGGEDSSCCSTPLPPSTRLVWRCVAPCYLMFPASPFFAQHITSGAHGVHGAGCVG